MPVFVIGTLLVLIFAQVLRLVGRPERIRHQLEDVLAGRCCEILDRTALR